MEWGKEMKGGPGIVLSPPLHAPPNNEIFLIFSKIFLIFSKTWKSFNKSLGYLHKLYYNKYHVPLYL